MLSIDGCGVFQFRGKHVSGSYVNPSIRNRFNGVSLANVLEMSQNPRRMGTNHTKKEGEMNQW